MQAHHLGHRGVSPDRAKLAEYLEGKWSRGLALHDAKDVCGALRPLPLRELTGRRRRLPVLGIDDRGTIANGPDVARAAQPHVRIGDQAALRFLRVEPHDNRCHRAANRANDRPAADKFTVGNSDPLRRGDGDAGVEEKPDAGRLHFFLREGPQRRRDFGKNLVARVNQDHLCILGFKIAEEARAAPNQVVYLARHLDAAVTAADDDEREIPAPALRVRADLRALHSLHHVRAQRDRVAHGLQRERVVRHPGHDVHVRHVAARDDEMIERQTLRRAVLAFVLDLVGRPIDSKHLLRAAPHTAKQIAQGHHDVERIERGADGVGQQRAEDEMILLVEDHDLRLVRGEETAQGLGAFHARETAAEDDDAQHGKLFRCRQKERKQTVRTSEFRFPRSTVSPSDRNRRADRRMRIITDKRHVLKAKREQIPHGRIEPQPRQGARLTRKLFARLLEVIRVEVQISKRMHKVARFQSADLGHHHRQQRV